MGDGDSNERGVATTSAGANVGGVAGDGRAVLIASVTWSLTTLRMSSILIAGVGAAPEEDAGASEAPGKVGNEDDAGGSITRKQRKENEECKERFSFARC